MFKKNDLPEDECRQKWSNNCCGFLPDMWSMMSFKFIAVMLFCEFDKDLNGRYGSDRNSTLLRIGGMMILCKEGREDYESSCLLRRAERIMN